MSIESLSDLPPDVELEADVLIVGGGACGLTLARELAGNSLRVIVLESGGETETPEDEALNAVEGDEGNFSPASRKARREYFGALSKNWSDEIQPYGLRCRGLGGSTIAWAGKSAPFDEIDFEARDWMPLSGWPVPRAELAPYIDRAAEHLNLGPTVTDGRLWEMKGRDRCNRSLDSMAFRPFFWQFARSRQTSSDIIRLGSEFLTQKVPNVRVYLHATVTEVLTDDSGARCTGVEVAMPDGRRRTVTARCCVLAASTIENARLLLMSRRAHADGLGNRNGLVGRYLIDHPLSVLARFDAKPGRRVAEQFGFVGLRHQGRSHVYMHGLALAPQLQRCEKLSHGAIFMQDERAPDDPFPAFQRLVTGRYGRKIGDLGAALRAPGLLARGIGVRALESDRTPEPLRRAAVEVALRVFPEKVVREFIDKGVPHKLTGLRGEGVVEQRPEADNRVTLSERRDALGQPLARVRWRVGDFERRTLMRMGWLMVDAFAMAELPAPQLSPWIAEGRPEDAVVIDLGHPMGTTRMADSPTKGVVDANQKVHDVSGLYGTGGSVFPTSGHANPTLMMLSLTIRLADHLKRQCQKERNCGGSSGS